MDGEIGVRYARVDLPFLARGHAVVQAGHDERGRPHAAEAWSKVQGGERAGLGAPGGPHMAVFASTSVLLTARFSQSGGSRRQV
jgi:hypothetical protein